MVSKNMHALLQNKTRIDPIHSPPLSGFIQSKGVCRALLTYDKWKMLDKQAGMESNKYP